MSRPATGQNARSDCQPGWRERIKVHPAAEVFPSLTRAELRELAEDIRQNGLTAGVTLYLDPATEEEILLDGRNRLDALELLGDEIFDAKGRVRKEWYEKTLANGYDPVAYVISANVRRRHLTKRRQADLIVAAVKAGKPERAKAARSVKRNAKGQVQGSEKDLVKEQVLAEAAKQGIGKRTATQALVDAEPERKRPKSEPRKQEIADVFVVETKRQHEIAGKAARRLNKALGGIHGYCLGLADFKVERAIAGATQDDLAEWQQLASNAATVLNRLSRTLKEARNES